MATAVFGTVELLEHIIEYLPADDIARNRRVDSHWRNVINGSKTLRRAAFLEPVTTLDITTIHGAQHSTVKAHPSIKKVHEALCGGPTLETSLYLFRFIPDAFLETPKVMQALICQPPPHKIKIVSQYKPVVELKNAGGITLGMLHEELKSICEEIPAEFRYAFKMDCYQEFEGDEYLEQTTLERANWFQETYGS